MSRGRFISSSASFLACVGFLLAIPAVSAAGGPIGGSPAGGLFYYSGSATMIGGGISGRTTICSEPGTRVLGGGFDTDTGSLNGRLLASFPADAGDADAKPDDGWHVDAMNLRQVQADLASYAICSADPVRYASDTVKVKGGKTATLEAACPAGTRGTAGGVEDASDIQVSGFYPVDGADGDSKPDDGWGAKVFNFGAAKQPVTVHAVCGKGLKMRYIADDAFPIGGDTQQGISATPCANEDSFLTGGGWLGRPPLTIPDARVTAMVPSDIGLDDLDAVPDDRMTFEEANDALDGGTATRYTACVVRG